MMMAFGVNNCASRLVSMAVVTPDHFLPNGIIHALIVFGVP